MKKHDEKDYTNGSWAKLVFVVRGDFKYIGFGNTQSLDFGYVQPDVEDFAPIGLNLPLSVAIDLKVTRSWFSISAHDCDSLVKP